MTSTVGPSSPWEETQLAVHLERLATGWRRPDGLFATAWRGARCVDGTPLLADLGDTAPFLLHFGHRDAALEQARLAGPWLRGGLFAREGRVSLFENHDYLLGLVDLYERTREPWLSERLAEAIRSLRAEFDVRGLLVDASPRRGVGALLPSACAFNGGFVELVLDLHAVTGEPSLVETARRWARAWVSTAYFRRRGLFARFNTPGVPIVGMLAGGLSRFGPVRLFKDNTNLVWSLAALLRVTRESWIHEALLAWLTGFEHHLWNEGRVRPSLSAPADGFDLIASTFSLDLLCDLTAAGIAPARTLRLARAVAAQCLLRAWPDGRFPTDHAANRDHFDVMTDIGVALCKLAELTGETHWRDAAWRGWRAQLRTHATADGFVLAVDRDGSVVDDRVFVKYQALALKSAILAGSAAPIYGDPRLWGLLRDR